MKKSDLKRMLKPLIKECVQEMILEEGLLTNIVSEVAAGMQGQVITETRQAAPSRPQEDLQIKQKSQQARKKLQEHRNKLMDAIGKDSYNGVDIFENVEPVRPQAATPRAGSVDLGDPNDSGVDISSILGNASDIWKALK
jgi:hypothetical protein